MLKNKAKWNKFNRDLIAEEKISYKQALKIYEALYKEAVNLGVFNSKNIFDGLEKNLRIAKAINRLK